MQYALRIVQSQNTQRQDLGITLSPERLAVFCLHPFLSPRLYDVCKVLTKNKNASIECKIQNAQFLFNVIYIHIKQSFTINILMLMTGKSVYTIVGKTEERFHDVCFIAPEFKQAFPLRASSNLNRHLNGHSGPKM